MMNFGVDIRKEFKEKLHSRLEFQRFDVVIRFMTTQIKNAHDMEKLHQQVDDQKKAKERHLERNQLLKQKLEEKKLKKEMLLGEIDHLKRQEQEIIKSQDSRVENVKYLWRSYMLAIDFYKSRLNCHVELHDDFIIWTYKNLFCESKKKYMVKLVNQDGRWSCTDMVPKLKTRDALMEFLKETNDIQGFLFTVRNRFKKIKN